MSEILDWIILVKVFKLTTIANQKTDDKKKSIDNDSVHCSLSAPLPNKHK